MSILRNKLLLKTAIAINIAVFVLGFIASDSKIMTISMMSGLLCYVGMVGARE